jgi:hypothetical protein
VTFPVGEPRIVWYNVSRLDNLVQLSKLNFWTLTHSPCETCFISLWWKIQHENSKRWKFIRIARTKRRDYLSRMIQAHIRAKLNQHSSGHKRPSLTPYR